MKEKLSIYERTLSIGFVNFSWPKQFSGPQILHTLHSQTDTQGGCRVCFPDKTFLNLTRSPQIVYLFQYPSFNQSNLNQWEPHVENHRIKKHFPLTISLYSSNLFLENWIFFTRSRKDVSFRTVYNYRYKKTHKHYDQILFKTICSRFIQGWPKL